MKEQPHSAISLREQERERELQNRHVAHERHKVIGLLVIALFILLLAFLRFGKSIPWGAR